MSGHLAKAGDRVFQDRDHLLQLAVSERVWPTHRHTMTHSAVAEGARMEAPMDHNTPHTRLHTVGFALHSLRRRDITSILGNKELG